MKDTKHIIVFSAIGLALAYVVSSPLRRPRSAAPVVGTPLAQAPEADSQPTPEPKTYVEGTVYAGAGVDESWAANHVLFITARAVADGKPMKGPPLAAKRVPAPTFPFTFSLTEENNIVAGEFYDGPLSISVRIDADGKAGPLQKDDIETNVDVDPAKTRRIKITLKR